LIFPGWDQGFELPSVDWVALAGHSACRKPTAVIHAGSVLVNHTQHE